MGIALILLGLLAAGVVVDFAVENDLAGAPERTYSLFGGSFTFNETQVVLGAALLGALAVLFVVLGIGMSRGSLGRRRALKHRVTDLERENDALRSKRTDVVTTDTRTGDVVRVEGETLEERRMTIAEREAAAREAAEREHAPRS